MKTTIRLASRNGSEQSRGTRVLPAVLFGVLLLVASSQPCHSHNLDYAVARVTFSEDARFQIEVRFHVAAYVMEAQPGHLDLDDWVRLRDMPQGELEKRIGYAEERFAERLRVKFGQDAVRPDRILFPLPALVREDGVSLTPKTAPPVLIQGAIPVGARSFALSFPYQIGNVLLTVTSPEGPLAGHFMSAGEESISLPILVAPSGVSVGRPSWWVLAWKYVVLGFEHILPGGVDHILFVLGLFLLSTRLATLLKQVTIFTAAHSVTLALSFYHLLSLQADVVEPLIALSICAVATENVLSTRFRPWRGFLVFGFGLLHGLGFANALRESGAAAGSAAIALASFNIGIEIGQLAVLLLAFAAVGPFQSRSWYRSRVSVPASCCIAAIGLWWAIQRAFAG